MSPNIKVYEPDLTGNESKYVNNCISTNWISSRGEYLNLFENKFEEYTNIKSTTVSNGTTSLHLALWSLGIKAGDEVLVPALTYIATANAVNYVGATPVFIDCDPISWQIDVNLLEAKITPKTKAIIVVHLYGFTCDLGSVKKICEKYNLLLIEDCAQALGTFYAGKHVGYYSDAATFSFFGNKTITTGEGGMLSSNRLDVLNRATRIKNQGVSLDKEYWHDLIGHNFRMTNLQAAIGYAQIERIHAIIEKKKKIHSLYKIGLADLPISFQMQDINSNPTCWMTSILVDSEKTKKDLRKFLSIENIETRPFFVPLHLIPHFNYISDPLPVSVNISSRGINLPSGTLNYDKNVAFVISKILNYYGKN